jgi:hypothetical protein
MCTDWRTGWDARASRSFATAARVNKCSVLAKHRDGLLPALGYALNAAVRRNTYPDALAVLIADMLSALSERGGCCDGAASQICKS